MFPRLTIVRSILCTAHLGYASILRASTKAYQSRDNRISLWPVHGPSSYKPGK